MKLPETVYDRVARKCGFSCPTEMRRVCKKYGRKLRLGEPPQFVPSWLLKPRQTG